MAATTFLISPTTRAPTVDIVDSKTHYFDVAPAIFILLVAWMSLGMLAESILVGMSFHLGQAVRLITLLLLLSLSRSSNPAIHWVGLSLLAVLQMAFVRLVTPGLS